VLQALVDKPLKIHVSSKSFLINLKALAQLLLLP
jgi:hypothetical protein